MTNENTVTRVWVKIGVEFIDAEGNPQVTEAEYEIAPDSLVMTENCPVERLHHVGNPKSEFMRLEHLHTIRIEGRPIPKIQVKG